MSSSTRARVIIRPRPPGRSPISWRTRSWSNGFPSGLEIAACAKCSMSNPSPGSAMRYRSIRFDRTQEIRTWRVEPTTPFDGVGEQLAKSLSDRFPNVVWQLRVELHDEFLNAFRHRQRTGRDDLQPLGPRRYHLDRQACSGRRRDHIVHHANDAFGCKWLPDK